MGWFVGFTIGKVDGPLEGLDVVCIAGREDGEDERPEDEETDCVFVGTEVGCENGCMVGFDEGFFVGVLEGSDVGRLTGWDDGREDGGLIGSRDGIDEGRLDGWVVGSVVGMIER